MASGGAGVLERVLDHVGDHPLQQTRGRRSPRGRSSGAVTAIGLGARECCARVHSATVARSTSALREVMAAGLQPAHVEQVGDQGVQPVGGLLHGGQQVLPVLRRTRRWLVLRRLEVAALIAASGRAQVVGDRGQQRRLGPVALGRAPGSGRRPPRPGVAPPGRRSGLRTRSAGSGRPPPAGGRAAPAAGRGRPRPGNSVRSARGSTAPQAAIVDSWSRVGRCASTSAAPVIPSTSPACRSSSTGSSPECSRLWASTASALASARARTASAVRRADRSTTVATADSDDDEHQDRERVLRVGDGEGAGRRHEQEVEREAARAARPSTAGHSPPTSAVATTMVSISSDSVGSPCRSGRQAEPSASSAVPSTASR